ncbi:hypothetical protein HO173_004452 [Letharia columbiana]|uniref:FAD-binding domain-containing protein n=1 Tax=Letharia columbiana TaxID=112416 RepID=A0A8H6FZD1_9LECA|nr:uncharacterized protein HO173_004452 [Letharia columbiana]KAF6237562.1 hypothetical protein HO173_004452 [Letharia columbiana]
MGQEAAKHYDEHANIFRVESLAGRFLGSFMKNLNGAIESIAPTMRLFVTQQMFEPIVCKKVAEEDGDLRFPSELIGFQQDVDGVTALVRNTETGGKTVIRSRYLIAADGNRSMVREKLGIGFESHGLLSHSITIYFDMDVGKYVKGSYNGVIYVNNDTVRSLFRIDKSGPEGFFVINTSGERGTERSRYPDDILTDEGAQEMLRAAVGNDNEFKITLISPWRAVCDNAERYPQGRVLLVGDAAATVTPNGGFSADSHNRRAGHADNIPVADLFGHCLVLLTGSKGQEWASAATRLRSETTLPEIRVLARASRRHAKVVPDPSTTLRAVIRKFLYLEPVAATQKNTPQAKVEAFLWTSALHVREKAVKAEIGELKGRLEQLDEHLKDLRRLGELQNEMALLAMKTVL